MSLSTLSVKSPTNFAQRALISAWGSFMCRKSTTQGQQLYFPSKGSHIQDFYTLKKILRPRPGLNPWSLDPVASMITTGPPGRRRTSWELHQVHEKHNHTNVTQYCRHIDHNKQPSISDEYLSGARFLLLKTPYSMLFQTHQHSAGTCCHVSGYNSELSSGRYTKLASRKTGSSLNTMNYQQ